MGPASFVLLLESETRCGFAIQVGPLPGRVPWEMGACILWGGLVAALKQVIVVGKHVDSTQCLTFKRIKQRNWIALFKKKKKGISLWLI